MSKDSKTSPLFLIIMGGVLVVMLVAFAAIHEDEEPRTSRMMIDPQPVYVQALRP
ncbi:MAG: hypothetical protein ACI9PY_002572 [Ascidiaceihabitans sp.]|jgi:hypothetical protein